jgi:hypothetical protein
MKQAIQRGAPINMLILDPTSSFCVMRTTEIGDFLPTKVSQMSYACSLKILRNVEVILLIKKMF